MTRTILDRVLTFIGAPSNDRVLPEHNFIFEIPYTPSVAELNGIIAQWQEEEHDAWDDVGFDFNDDPTRLWLSSATLKAEVEVPDDLHSHPGSLAPAQALLDALREHRDVVTT
ncbi:MAG: hypothetical protein ABR964_12760 [Tepidisphaeraceae bacterium]